jgi:hypothetical protein
LKVFKTFGSLLDINYIKEQKRFGELENNPYLCILNETRDRL